MLNSPIQRDLLWNLKKEDFLGVAKQICDFQMTHNEVYKNWVNLSRQDNRSIDTTTAIPFLPIQLYKTQPVFIGTLPTTLFESSGTTEDVVSKHWVSDTSLYEDSFSKCFQLFYGHPTDYCIIALLPSYLERQHSSLVYMAQKLIQDSKHPNSGFYLNEFEKLDSLLKQLESKKQKVWFIGVSFGLMDFADAYPQQLKYTTVIETGGMKGRKKELSKQELHEYLQKRLGVGVIHSEYGMTELLSQAYSEGEGIFRCPPWMKVLVGDEQDPTLVKTKGIGVLHVIDLANIWSCSFIATQDRGEVFEDGRFTVLGRVENSDRRGCSLLAI
jgi:phenylacetate-coenzyme A ligase PaaK-like adenylate-forming protein